jgi:hypothetical protein
MQRTGANSTLNSPLNYWMAAYPTSFILLSWFKNYQLIFPAFCSAINPYDYIVPRYNADLLTTHSTTHL